MFSAKTAQAVNKKQADEEGTSVAQALGSAAHISIDGVSYEIRPLTMGDFADAEQYIRDQRINSYLKQVRTLMVDEVTKAKSIAEIVHYQVTLHDVFQCYEGKLYLLYLAVRKNETLHGAEFRDFKLKIDAMPMEELSGMVALVTGITIEEEEDENPTNSTPEMNSP